VGKYKLLLFYLRNIIRLQLDSGTYFTSVNNNNNNNNSNNNNELNTDHLILSDNSYYSAVASTDLCHGYLKICEYVCKFPEILQL
jgi:hypothetical protein